MGLLSFMFGACLGYYFRNTALAIDLRRFLAASKFLKNKGVIEYKLALIVRDDLNMSKGKIASQCSHASVLAYKNAYFSDPELVNLWEAFGQGKIILKISNEQKLIELLKQSKTLGLWTNIVCDAGKTQVIPETKTVLAIGPGPKDVIDKVTGHLKLL